MVSRVVVKGCAGSNDNCLAFHPGNGREDISGEGQVRRALLQAYLAETLANRNLRDLVGIDAEAPVRSDFSGRIVRFISLNGGLTKAEKSSRRVLEVRTAEVEKISPIAERRISIVEEQFAFDFLRERRDELDRPVTRNAATTPTSTS